MEQKVVYNKKLCFLLVVNSGEEIVKPELVLVVMFISSRPVVLGMSTKCYIQYVCILY